MVQIVLSTEQAKVIQQAVDGIELLDPDGHPVGIVTTGFTAEDLRTVRQRMASNEPGLPLEQLLERLQSRRSEAAQ
jgi:hypothetical protein